MEELNFLYLVNCENKGEAYWEIGLTENANPLEDNKNFIECYRNELIGVEAAKQVVNAIDINLANLIQNCIEDGYTIDTTNKGISYDIPLNIIEDIYDFWLNLYKDNESFLKVVSLLTTRKKIDFSNPSIANALKGFTAIWASKIEDLHSYRPPSKKTPLPKEPMWKDSEK